ncbi:MAG: PQQ-binding-like beta-propeller repeat protein [Thermoguttaceae bacterium]|jgi:outer membrane protein assembly factor BamB
MPKLCSLLLIAFVLPTGPACGLAAQPDTEAKESWLQWGGSPERNNASGAKGLVTEWNVGEFDPTTGQWQRESAKHIKWVAKLGSESYGSPVIAAGKVFCATNNGAGYLKRYPTSVDLGCLLAFRQDSGQFLWQFSSEKLKAGRDIDWPQQGICCTPLIEGDRLWTVTNRGEVVCLDIEGFYDNQNDGPITNEPPDDRHEADLIWRYNLMRQLGSVQHNMCSCSVTTAGDLLMVCTSNGIDGAHETIPAPEAPSFIALDKHTGKLLWADNSPGKNILHGQWGSPAFAVLGGAPQVVFPGGDGWLYSFLAKATADGKPKLLWQFDCNPKAAVWEGNGQGDRNELIATPVIWDGRVYIATGQDPEAGEGPADLWCIDPTRRGDVSAEIVVDRQGKSVPHRRTQAVNKEAGEEVRPNPNSAAVWHYRGHDADGDGKLDFKEVMHRTLGMAAIKDGILVIGDFGGLVHCLDAKTGNVHWTYDMLAAIWGSPLIADGKIFLGDEDGDVAVFEFATQQKLLAENPMGNSVYSSPVAVGHVLYISTRSHLVAIEEKAE